MVDVIITLFGRICIIDPPKCLWDAAESISSLTISLSVAFTAEAVGQTQNGIRMYTIEAKGIIPMVFSQIYGKVHVALKMQCCFTHSLESNIVYNVMKYNPICVQSIKKPTCSLILNTPKVINVPA